MMGWTENQLWMMYEGKIMNDVSVRLHEKGHKLHTTTSTQLLRVTL